MRKKRLLTLVLAGFLAFGSVPIGNIPFTSYARTEEEINSEIEKLEKELEELNNKISELEDGYGSTDDKDEIKELDKKIKELDKQVKEVEDKLTKLYNEEPISGGGALDKNEQGPGVGKEEEETEEPLSPVKPDTDNADLGNLNDLVVSQPNINSSSGSVRVTEIYSINNQKADCYYRPKVDEVPLLANRVLKMGNYAAAYTGFFDLDYSSPNKPKGEASRALEILGYDFLLKEEKYDPSTEKYSKIVLGEDRITEETAIMDLYKALGIELFDIKMTHKKANYTSGNSPAASLLNRSTITYSGGGDNPIRSTDTMVPFETYVFVSRTNPQLYMKKVSQDFNVSISTNKSMTLTNADFIKLAAKMMQFYGEPEMSKNEMNQLVQVYGEEVPSGMEDSLKEAWIYLKARGVLNIEDLDLYGFLSKEDMFDILMRIKDKDSRVNYKDIQVTISLDQAIINQGYFPSNSVTVAELDKSPISTTVDYSKSKYYDYLVPITDFSRFKSQNGGTVNTMFASDSPTGIGSAIPGSAYIGIEQQKYYHYKVPINLSDSQIYNNSYVRIDTPDNNDKPGAIYLQLGGGILFYDTYKEDADGSRVNFFKRRPFLDTEFEDYVDENRRDPTKEFDWDAWNSSNGTSDPEEGYEDNNDDEEERPNLGHLGFDDWQGASIDQVVDFHWAKDETNGRWRCYKDKGYDKEFLQGGVYYLGGDEIVGNPQDNMFAFDNDGYMVTGWWRDGYYWLYFDENGHMTYSKTLTIDGVEYEFDQYGCWIDMIYNVPEDYEDIWAQYDNVEGTWQLEDDNKWWYMLTDGNWLFGEIYRINDKFYAFDDDGYMRTGWVKYYDYWYWFDESDGYMYINSTTPDGTWCGKNGRAVGQWKLSFKNSAVYKMFAGVFSPMVAYAADAYTPDDASSLVGNDSRWYVHKIPKDMVVEGADQILSILKDKNVVQGESVTEGGSYYKIVTQRNKANILSLLTIKPEFQSNILQGVSGILNISDDSKMLVPYIDLYNMGIVSRVKLDNKDQIVTLDAGFVEDDSNNQSTFRSFGQIVLDNNNKTILVGTTIYRLSDQTTLFQHMPASETTSYEYVDSNGKLQTSKGDMLYVDLRAVYGWSADNISFYRDGTGQFYVTTGKARDPQSKAKVQNVNCTVENGKKGITVTKVTGYDRDLLLLSNIYPIANWAVIRNSNRKSTESNNLVVAYYDEMFTDDKRPNDYQKLVDMLNTKKGTPKFDGYCYRLFDLDENGAGVTTIKPGMPVEKGKFYFESDYGLVYALPTNNEWKSENGYDKYLSGEWPIPMVTTGGQLIDKSVPYIEGKDYGATVMSDSNKINVLHPQIAALAYFLYAQQSDVRSLDSIQAVNHDSNNTQDFKDEALIFFGQNRIYKNAKGDYVIDGVSHFNDIAKINKKDFDYKDYISVNLYTSYGHRQFNTIGGTNNGTRIYVNIPSKINYETAAEDIDDERRSTFNNNGSSDIFGAYEEFKLNELIKKIDEATSFVILIAMQVLPLTLFTLSMIVLLFSLMGEWKAIRMLCEKFFDPIEILTFGRRNIETANGIGYFVSVLITTISFALWANGNFLRILAWIFRAAGEFMNILNNM